MIKRNEIPILEYDDSSMEVIPPDHDWTAGRLPEKCLFAFLGDVVHEYAAKHDAKVVDGDTIYLDNGEKVRFVGVNTPERGVEGYIASKNFVQKLCLNKEVGLDIDDSKHNDKYGRTLAVVIVDGKNVNEMLLKEGLAEIMYMPPSEFYPYNWANSDTHVADSHSSSSSSSSSSDTSHSSSSSSGSYVGNANTGKFHVSSCSSVSKMSEGNKVFFSNRNDAVNQGYVPCKRCNP